MMLNKNLKELESKYHELLINLSEEDLKQYIKSLADNYYNSYLSNEKEVHESTFKQLEEVNSIYKVKYSDFTNYINFCLLNAVNKILNENISSDMKLELIETSEDYYFSDNPFKNLINAFEESRALYNESKTYEKRIEELERKLAKYEGVNSK